MLVLCIGTVSAETPSDSAVMNSTTDTPASVSVDTGGAETLLGASNDGSFSDLNDKIKDASENTIIDLYDTYIYNNDDDSAYKYGIVISKDNITIDGHDSAIIDGNNLARAFYIAEGVTNFTLKNIVVQNAYATSGSAIYFVDKMTNVEISGTFTNNIVKSNGIFYFADGISGNVKFNGDFTNNNANNGNNALVNFGTIYNGSNVVLKGNYKKNTAKGECAVAYFPTIEEGATVILEGTFDENQNGGNPYGAAPVAYFGYLKGNVILNGTFTNNLARGAGGVVYVYREMNGNLILSGTFTNNTATGSGGVIYVNPTVKGNITLSGTFDDNSANVGGVIYFLNDIDGDVTLSGTFTNNNATNGAVAYTEKAVNGNIYVSGQFTNNDGYGLINLKDAGTFSNVHSTASVEGIGVRTSISATLPNSIYSGNKLKAIAKLNGIYDTLWTTDYKGTVIKLNVNNKDYTTSLNESGYGEFIIDDLNTPGKYEVKVFYEGNETYLPCENIYNITVSSNSPKSFTELYEKINNNTDEIIYLEGEFAFDFVDDADLQNGVNIYRNIIIDGQGKTVIDGAGLARIFYVNSGVTDFTLKNVIVKNSAHVVYVGSAIDNIEINGTFINNAGAGSVLYANGVVGNVILDGEFYNNTGSYGSIAFFNSDANGEILFNGTYINNSATQQGGLFYFRNVYGNINLPGTFINNSVARDGGIIIVNSALQNGASIVLSGTFTNNTALSGGVLSVMGNSPLGTVVLSGTFTDNNAGNGGVAQFNNNIGTVTVTGTFDNNTATYGGVLNIPTSADTLTINGASFTNNSAELGSVLRLNNIVSTNIADSDFVDNEASEWTVSTTSAISLGDNVKFENNIGGDISNLITSTSLTVTLSQSTIYENRNVLVKILLSGIKNYNNDLVKVYISDEYYCDILVDDVGEGNITLSNLRRDVYDISAYYAGTKIYSPSNSSATLKVIASTNTYTYKLLNETINNNIDDVVYLVKGNYTFDSVEDADLINGIIIDRDIVIDGMGSIIDGASLARLFLINNTVKSFELRNVTVQNSYSVTGGVIYCNGALNHFVLNGTFINNYASGSGGVVYAYNGLLKDFTLDGTYYKNHASTGGVICMSPGYGSLIGNFTENYASGKGGVLVVPYGSNPGNSIAFDGYFRDNYVTQGSGNFNGGGVAYAENSNYNNWIFNGTFIGNHAPDGGVVLLPRNLKSIELSGTFEDNYATNRGGIAAIDTTNSKYALGDILVTGNFTGNSAPNAAIVWTPSNLDTTINSVIVENATFTNNTATTGGALLLNNVKDGEIKNSTFAENKARTGGAIILNTDNVNVANNTFTGNVATISGQNILSLGDNTFDDDNIYDGILSLNETRISFTLSSNSVPANRKVLVTVTLSGLNDYTDVTVKLNVTPGIQKTISLDETGTGSVILEGLDSRVYNIVAYYEGNDKFSPSNSTSQALIVLDTIDAFNYSKINESIHNNTDGVVCLVKGNYTFDSVEDADLIKGIIIDRGIVIDGMGSIIDGASLARLFKINNNVKNFELRNVTVQNSKADGNGGVILCLGQFNKFVLNGTFINNYASASGGVVNGYGESGNTFALDFILDGTYYKNSAVNGGVIQVGSASGQLIGNFTENTASGKGGVICFPYGPNNNYAANGIKFTGYFENNRAGSLGGVAYAENNIYNKWTFNGTFIGNKANDGGVLTAYRNMQNVEFAGSYINNTATNRGSVACIDSSNAKYTLGNIILSGEYISNVAADSLIWTPSNSATTINSIIIENATFENNTATNGDLLKLNNVKDLDITNSSFTGSSVTGSVIAVGGTTADADIHDVNVTDTKGTAITVSSQDTDISNVTIDNVINANGIVVNDNTNIDNVTVTGVGENYYAIDVNGDNATITNSTIADNAGIGINIDGDNATITNNNNTGNNIGIKLNGDNATISSNNLTNNTLGLLIVGDDTTVLENTFGDNENDVSIDENSNSNTPEFKEEIKLKNYPVGEVNIGTDPNLEVTNVTSSIIEISLPDDAEGYLLIDIDGIGYYKPVNGNVTFDVPDSLAPGDYTVNIHYLGDGNYTSASVKVNLTIPKINVDIFDATGSTVSYGEDAIVIVLLPKDANGTISVNVNNMIKKVNVVNGSANVTFSNLNVGEYNATVSYSGDDKYEEYEGYALVNVTKLTPTINVDVDSEFDYGDVVVVNVTLPSNAMGNVTVNIAGKNYTVASGDKIEIIDLNAGNYNIVAVYDGDNIYMPNMNFTSFTISPVNSTLTVNVDSICEGNDAIVNITLVDSEGNNLTGIVTVKVNDTSIDPISIIVNNGSGSGVIAGLSVGQYNVTVEYSGSLNYVNSTNNTVFSITAKNNVSINVSDVIISVGENATVNVNISDAVNGQNITITVNGKKQSVTVVDGKASANFTDLKVGEYDILVEYPGDETYNANSANATLTVNQINTDLSVHKFNQPHIKITKLTLDRYLSTTFKKNKN